jgi:hypothetical protein
VSSLFFHFSTLFSFFLFISFFQLFPLSQAASVATLPSALFVSDCSSVQVGCTRFSRCCYLVIDLCSLFRKELVQALSQSPDLGGRARLFGYPFSSFLAPFSFFLPFPVSHREISTQDRLGTTIANSVDP